MKKTLVRLVAVYLWWFVIVFILAISSPAFLAEGTWLGGLLMRRPYQWDFELMFTVLFLIWGIFLWKASINLPANRALIQFSAWAFLSHGIIFIVIGLINDSVLTHAITDSIWWLATGIVLFKANPEKKY